MKKKNSKKTLKTTGKGMRGIVRFSLHILENILADSIKEEEHKPTLQELMCGEKVPGSDKYFIPNDKKLHK